MSWYKQVFTGEAPPKNEPPIMKNLPRVIEDPNLKVDEEKLAELQNQDDLKFIFSNKFFYAGIPSDIDQRINFLNNKQPRELNPANLPSVVSGWNPVINTAQYWNTGIKGFLYDAIQFINPMNWLPQQQMSVKRGGAKTQKKRSPHNLKKSQRKRYSE